MKTSTILIIGGVAAGGVLLLLSWAARAGYMQGGSDTASSLNNGGRIDPTLLNTGFGASDSAAKRAQLSGVQIYDNPGMFEVNP